MRSFRSLLFVPADRPDRFARACAAGTDAVCLDLEDAVAPAGKAAARAIAAEYLGMPRTGSLPALGVRINALDTEWAAADLDTVAHADFVMIPKAVDEAAFRTAAARLPAGRPWPLVETAAGLRDSWAVAATPGVAGVLFGAFDYAADVGCTMEWEALLYARGRLAAACAAARVQLLDAPSGDLKDPDGLQASTSRARALGFTGRACIHPDQIAPVHAAFTPSEAEVAQARRIVEAFDAAGGGAAQLDGKLVERPVVVAARRILDRA